MTLKSTDIQKLRELRETLIEDKDAIAQEARRVERWKSFQETTTFIAESVDKKDLVGLVSSVRKMKNLLRRSSVKKELSQLEGNEDKSKEISEPKGSCKCSVCSADLDSSDDCVEGVLCVKCAMKNRRKNSGEQEAEKDEKKAKKGVAFPPEMVGMGGATGGGSDSGDEGEDEGDAPVAPSKKSASSDNTDQDDDQFVPKKKKKKKKKKKFDDEDSFDNKEQVKKKTESKLRRRVQKDADFGI